MNGYVTLQMLSCYYGDIQHAQEYLIFDINKKIVTVQTHTAGVKMTL